MPRSSFSRYIVALVAWAAFLLMIGALILGALDYTGRLPPPPLTATNCIDEKFQFLRETSVRSPEVIAVGSSVTWRNLDFSVLEHEHPESIRVLNAAPCYLNMDRIAYLTRFYLDNMPSVRVVVSVFAMRDFVGCTGDPAFFDPKTARQFIFERKPAWHLYFQNFRPYSFFTDVLRIRNLRAPMGGLSMDSYGSGPTYDTPPVVGNDVTTMPACFDHMEPLARDLEARGVSWVAVLLPAMPSWIRSYDPSRTRDAAWRETVLARLRDSGAVVLDGRRHFPVQDDDFTDPAHLHWTAAARFTAWIFESLGERGASREVTGAL